MTLPSRPTARWPHADLIERGKLTTLTLRVYVNGTLTAPDSAPTATLKNASGESVSIGSVTIASDVSKFDVAAATTTDLTLDDHWQVVWTATVSSVVYVFTNPVKLVRYILSPVLTDEDLYRTHPRLNPSASDKLFSSISNWESFRAAAWERIQRRLIKAGKRPWLAMSPSDFMDLHSSETKADIFEAASTLLNDSYGELARTYRKRAEDEWARLNFVYDRDENGLPDESTRDPGEGSCWLMARR